MSRANRVGTVFLLFVLAPIILHGWIWPTEEVDTLHYDREPSKAPIAPVEYLRFSFSSGETFSIRSPIDGQVVMHGREAIILRDINEFWIVLETEEFQWSGIAGIVPQVVTVGETLGTGRSVSVTVYDRLNERYVNPRAVFPYLEQIPSDGIPPLAVVQDDRVVPIPERGIVDIQPGEAHIIVAQGVFDPTRLPRTMYILRNGLVDRQLSFLFEDELTPLIDAEGNLVLLETSIDPGVNEFELEARAFDGTRVRRMIRLRGQIPMTDAGPLDTP